MAKYFNIIIKSFFYQILLFPLCLSIDSKALNEILLKEHNKYRLLHNSRALLLENKIIKDATVYAESLVKNSEFIGSSGIYYKGDEKYGENIFQCNNKKCKSQDFSLAVTTWYSESSSYNFDSNIGIKGTYNFTQMIWKSTKKMGCGIGQRNDENYIIVCFYYPRGNIDEQYLNNVFIGNNTKIDNNIDELDNYADYDAYINNERYFDFKKINIILIIFILFIEFI